MSSLTFEIFRTNEDRVKWDKHIEHVDVIDEFTVEQKDRVKEALSYLRRPEVLGEGFLAHAYRTAHPLFYYFNNTVPWTRKWLIRFAGAMKDLQSAGGFATCMKEQIKDADKFTERESVLDIAYKFFNAGFEVSFDPAVTVSKPHGFTKRLLPSQALPDLKIVNKETGEEMFIEVSALGESDSSKQVERTYKTVFDVLVAYGLWQQYLFPRARVRRILEDDELKLLVGKLMELLTEVKSSGEVRYLINEEIEVCVAPAHLKDIPDQWATERGITGAPVESPVIPPNDPFRIKRIIRKEEKQLPERKPGIVVITTDWTLLFFAHGIGAIASELEEVLRDLPKLSCAVASCTYQGGDKEGYVGCEGPHTAIKRVNETELIEQTVISLNPSCAFPLSNSTVEKMRGAFIHG